MSDDDLDPVEKLLKPTGCLELHYQVQFCPVAFGVTASRGQLECIAETKDWRKCKDAVEQFKNCMEKHKKSQIPTKH